MDDNRKEIEKLVCKRVIARADRDYDEADSIRDDLRSRFGTFHVRRPLWPPASPLSLSLAPHRTRSLRLTPPYAYAPHSASQMSSPRTYTTR